MYLGSKRFILFLFYCFTFFAFKAQTLYWVGGSGNFNDPNHWSLTSGGKAVGVTPNASNDVLFDDNSTPNYTNPVVTFVGTNFCKSLKFTNEFIKYTVTGSKFTEINISGDFQLNYNTDFLANSKLVFNSNSAHYNAIRFNETAYAGDVVFKSGNWNLKHINIDNASAVNFISGNYKVISSKIKTGNFYANTSTVNFEIKSGNLDVANTIEIGSNAHFLSQQFSLRAEKSNPLKYKVDPAVNFGNGLRMLNSTNVSCTASLSSVGISCSGVCDGKLILTIDPSCAAGPYNLAWNNPSCPLPTLSIVPGPGTYTISNLCSCADFYDVTVFTGTVPIAFSNAVAVPGVSAIGFTPLSFVQPTCFGFCNGSITGNIGGSVAPYTVTVFTGSGSSTIAIPAGISTFTNLCAGLNTLTILDTKGCTRSFTPSLSQPPALLPNAVTHSVTCNALCNGNYSISPTGGTANYTVNFSTGPTFTLAAGASATIGGLCPSAVSATVTDSKGCSVVSNTTIIQPTSLTVTATQTNVSCGGLCNGEASVAITGGTSPYTYTWAPGPNTSTNVISSLCAGTQTVNILDNNLCPATHNFTITSPPPITLTPTFTNVTCNSLCNGKASVVGTGGTGAITFTWIATGPATIAVNQPSATNLCAGTYTIFAKDAAGCFTTSVISITQPPALTITAVTQSVTCFGFCNGAASVTPTGGNGAPFSFTLSSSASTVFTSPPYTNLCQGTYTVAVKDASLCPTSTVITVTQPASVTPNITTASLSCNGVPTGSINANPSPVASGPFTYTLASPASTIFTAPPYTALPAGIYTLTIGYGAGCSQSFTINIQQPNPLIPSISSTSITCFNACNGTLAGSASGGTPLYSFSWTTPTVTVPGGVLSGQCAGTYTFHVTDANGCTASSITTLSQPSDMTVSITSTSPNCFGDCNGVLSASVTGGTPGYTLTWSNGPVGNPNTALCAGGYTLVVNDTKGCTKTVTASIVSPTSLTLTQVTASTSCAGTCDGSATITATGGTAPYIYQFNSIPAVTNTTGVISGLCAGNYIANVTDAKGCTKSINFSIVSPIALSAAITGLQSSCNACTGASTVTASNGTPGYNYVWTNSLSVSVGTNAVVGSLCPGQYTATVTDSKGCTATATANVVQTVSVTVVTAGSVIQCFGACTGSATANAVGGTLPYTYTWTPTGPPTQTTQTAGGLCAGNYMVTVADQLGCSATGTITFTNPPDIIITASQTNVNCFGNCNGSITTTVTGGTAPLSYSWSPGSITTPNLTGLCAGSYTLKVTDGKGCSKTQVFSITAPAAIAATFTTTNPSGCVLSNGSICATASGGTGSGYTYTWSPSGGIGINTSCYSGLPAGPYSLIIGNAGCTATLSAILTNPTGPTLNVTTQSVTCFGASTGAATVTAVGAGPFTFTWTPAVGFTTIGNTTSASGLNTGTYNISVTNIPTGCITTQSIVITQPATSLTINSTVSNAKCFGSCNGSITVVPSGATPNYTYSWLPSAPPITGQGTGTVTNLCLGTYSLNITDANSCPRQFTFTIGQPAALSLTATASNVLCNNACNGSITASSSGGTAPVTYSWLPVGTFTGSANPTIFNLCPAVYTVIAKDGNNCSITKTVQINQPTALTATISVVNASCSNSCNATASLTPGGGTPTYSFSWSSGPVTTPSIGSLCAGNYTGTVIDTHGCTTALGFTVIAPSSINVTLTPANPLCNGVCNGSITSIIAGAQGTVNYNWAPSAPNSGTVSGLCANNYTLTATDSKGCVATGVTNLVNPPSLLSNISFTNPACNGNCNGVAISTPANAVGTVNYTWSPSGPNSATLSALCAGSYAVSIKDGNNCTDVQTFTLVNPPVLNVNSSVGPATCGSPNGSITVIPTGGTPAYSYTWAAPATGTNPSVSGLAAGIYTVVVHDANNCTNTLTIPLSNSNGPSSAPITSSSISCNAQCTGAASVNIGSIVGGTPGYTVTWVVPPSSSSSNPQTNLCAGTYSAQIMDANSCLLFNSVVISQPAAISILPSLTFPTCNGVCDGSIVLNTSGGFGSTYTYTWNPGSSSTSTLTNACAGNYNILIGNNGCAPVTQTVSLPGVQNIMVSTAVTNNLCFGNCNGTASVTAVSGSTNLPVTFAWSNSQVGPDATNLCNGIYTVTATDAIGCFNSYTTNVISPTQLSAASAITSPSCNMCNGSSTVSAAGGTGPYTYSWTSGSTGSTVSNLCAGLYQILITDNNLCTQLQNITISNSNGITGQNTNIQNELCAGQCNGAATVTAIGGTAPISYNWISPAVSNSVITNLCSGTYFLQMMDAQGCIRTSSVNINAAAQLTLTPSISAPGCSLGNGSINIVATGGNPLPFYIYSWAPVPSITSSLTNISSGNYTVTVTDGSGCSKTQAFAVNNPNGPAITFTQSNIDCFNACTGSIIALGTSTASPVNYNWSTGSTSPNVTGLCKGVVTLTVSTPGNGCKTIQSFTLTDNPALMLSLSNIQQPKCHDDCNGAITLVPSGGTLPFVFSWSPSATGNPQFSLCPGPASAPIVYSATVMDAKGCSISISLTLVNPSLIVLTPTVINSSCSSINDGALNVGVNGGTPAYSYTWTGPSAFTATTQNISSILAGTYSLSLTDFNGCRHDTVLNVVPTVSIVAQAGNDVTVCPTPSVALTGTNSFGAVTYNWFLLPNITNTVANTAGFSAATPPTAPGSYTYELLVTSSVAACFDKDTVVVNVYALPFADAGPTYTIPVFSTVTIGGNPTATGNYSLSWSPSFNLDDPIIPNPSASNTVNTVYTVTVVDLTTGCTASDTMTVFLYPVIKIPNGFTPNGDTKNDKWIIDYIDQFPDNTVEVYNRWGEQLFYSQGYTIPFDGKYKGKDLPVGTYYYVINLNHPAYKKPYTGPLTIFR